MACNEIGNQLIAGRNELTEKGKEPKRKTESLFRRILDLVPEEPKLVRIRAGASGKKRHLTRATFSVP